MSTDSRWWLVGAHRVVAGASLALAQAEMPRAAAPTRQRIVFCDCLDCVEQPPGTDIPSSASPAALEAGNAFVQRVLASRRPGEGGMAGPELAAMLLFSAVFGYMLRTIEARRDLEASLLLPS